MSDLETRIGEISDALRISENLVECFRLDTDGELSDHKEAAIAIQGDLECAEVVETLVDFEANLDEAKGKAEALLTVLKTLRFKGDLGEIVSEAKSDLKALIGELNNLGDSK